MLSKYSYGIYCCSLVVLSLGSVLEIRFGLLDGQIGPVICGPAAEERASWVMGSWPNLLDTLSPKRTLKESSDSPTSAFAAYLWQTVFTESFWANSKSIFMRLLVSTYPMYQDFRGSCWAVPVTTVAGSMCLRNYTACLWHAEGSTEPIWTWGFFPFAREPQKRRVRSAWACLRTLAPKHG